MVNFNELLNKFTAMVTADKVTNTAELFKYDKAVLGEGGDETENAQSKRTNGTAKVETELKYRPKDKTHDKIHTIIMDIYVYSDDINIDLESFAKKIRVGILRFYDTKILRTTDFNGNPYDEIFNFDIKVQILSSVEEAEKLAQMKPKATNLFYVYKSNILKRNINSAYGGNSGILYSGASEVALSHEIGHVLGYYEENIKDWTHSQNVNDLMFGSPEKNNPNLKLTVYNVLKFNFGKGFEDDYIGMPCAYAIYDKTFFNNISNSNKPVPIPKYFRCKEFKTMYSYDFLSKSYPPINITTKCI